MQGYNQPSFQDRAAASSRAKEKALAKVKAAPQLDAAALAEIAARRAEQKAARDARYAACKSRK